MEVGSVVFDSTLDNSVTIVQNSSKALLERKNQSRNSSKRITVNILEFKKHFENFFLRFSYNSSNYGTQNYTLQALKCFFHYSTIIFRLLKVAKKFRIFFDPLIFVSSLYCGISNTERF